MTVRASHQAATRALIATASAGINRSRARPISLRDSHVSRIRARMFAVVAAAILLAACGNGGVTGAGPAQRETRDVDAFTRVEVGNGIGLTLHVGGSQAVELVAQENILGLITTTVEDGVLRISATDSFTTSTGVTVIATVQALKGLSASGGSQAQIDGLTGDALDIDLTGGARLMATGQATDVTLSASAGAAADLGALAADTMDVDLSGGATVALNVSDRLTGSASGGAVATVAGLASVEVETSGGARVTEN